MITITNEMVCGNVAYENGEQISYNYNNMKQEDVTLVAEEITSLVSELEARYANVALMSN